MKDKILIFIITYKASFRVLDVIKKIPFRYLKNKNYKILISDDDSRDNTIEFIKKIKKRYSQKIIVNFNRSNMGYGKGNPVSPDMLNTLKGSWVPNTTFEKLGYGPGSTKQWFFSRSSPRHFGPVEKMMSWGRAGLPYLKQGAKFLKKAIICI